MYNDMHIAHSSAWWLQEVFTEAYFQDWSRDGVLLKCIERSRPK
jgi:hypothetical protein